MKMKDHKMSVDMVPALRAHYLPMINDRLTLFGVKPPSGTSFYFVERMDVVSGLRFEVALDFGTLTFDQLTPVIHALDYFCVTDEYENGLVLDGYRFLLGDGDDTQAVRLEDGKFKIWLRGWKHD